jgi:hypothetical protein
LAWLAGAWAIAILVAWSVGHWQWMALGSRYVPPAPGTATLLLLSAASVRDGIAYVNDIHSGLWIVRMKPKQPPSVLVP